MKNQLSLFSLDAISDLRTSINRFQSNCSENIIHISSEIAKQQEWLLERLQYWNREVEKSNQRLITAEASLKRCQNRNSKDNQGHSQASSCCSEEKEVVEAKKAVLFSKQYLSKVQIWKTRYEQIICDYRRQENQFKNLVIQHSDRASSHLQVLRSHYEVVLDSEKSIHNENSYSDSSLQFSSDNSHLPIQNGLDFRNIDLEKIPLPEDISGNEDFKKTPIDVMKNGMNKFEEMKSAISSGEGKSSDYWAKVDQEKGLSYENGYQRTFDSFYGNDPIAIEIHDGSYNILSGRHRIWLAKNMGIDSLPMIVVSEG